MSSDGAVRGELFLVSAPSGAGKTTLIRGLLARLGREAPVVFSVSHTTRAARAGEREGHDYHFVDRPRFDAMAAAGEFLEWAEVHGNRYGTSAAAVLPHLERGCDVLVDLDVQGAEQLMRRYPEAQSVFVLPPSYAVLAERLRGRGLDDGAEIQRRLAVALQEMRRYRSYRYVIVNDDLERASAALEVIVTDKRQQRARLEPRIAAILADFEGAGARAGV
jgi:guanylate kinase